MSFLDRVRSATIDRFWRPSESAPPQPLALAADHPTTLSPSAVGITVSSPPTGPRRGTRVAVSVYVPWDADLGPVVAWLVTLGYQQLEVRQGQHAATRSRVSGRAVVPQLTVDEARVKAAIASQVIGASVDVQQWPAY